MTKLLFLAALTCAGAAGFADEPGPWISLFDGKSLAGWNPTPFTGRGTVKVENGAIILGNGTLTGITRTMPLPKSNYEVRLEAVRMEGSDFFAGITFPVQDSYCSWIIGGWGGSVVGLSSLDDYDASENETSISREFVQGRWYSLSLRVTDGWIQAWIDDEKLIEVATANRKISLRLGEIDLSMPFGIASYSTVAGLRKLEYRTIPPPPK